MGEDPDQIRREIEQTRRELGRDVDALTEKVSPTRVVGRRVERARGKLTAARERVMGSVHDTTSSAQAGLSSAGDAASSAPDAVRRRTEGNPLAAGLIAFGVGWLVSSLLPASEREQQAAARVKDVAQDKAQPLVEEAKQVATQVKDDLQPAVQDAVASVKSTASDSASTVVDEGRTAAQHRSPGTAGF